MHHPLFALVGLFALQFLPYFQDFEGLMLFSGGCLVFEVILLVRRRSDIPRRHRSGP